MSAPPSAALRLLREGHTVARVIEWTGCNRWHLVLALHAEGMYVDRDTDTAREMPVPEAGPPWRRWARVNGWPDLPDNGALPTGLLESFVASTPDTPARRAALGMLRKTRHRARQRAAA